MFPVLDGLNKIRSEWEHCTRCPLGEHATKHVLWEFATVTNDNWVTRAVQPFALFGDELNNVKVVLVGEGPGVSENTIGRPFTGIAGQVLRRCLKNAIGSGYKLEICLANLLACRPFVENPSFAENREPTSDEIEMCSPRLRSLIQVLHPQLIVALGNVSAEYLPKILERTYLQCNFRRVRHPSYIARTGNEAEYTAQLSGYISDYAEEDNSHGE